jgi:uncharacterized protein (TIGR02246 family)
MSDTTEIEKLVATVQHSQQNELAEEFVGLFREDAIWTTAHGKRLTGLDEIASFTRRRLPGSTKEATATYEVENVLFIRPDVAAVKIRQRPVTLDGTPIPDQNEGSPLYILSKEDGTWKIAAGQNTIVL